MFCNFLSQILTRFKGTPGITFTWYELTEDRRPPPASTWQFCDVSVDVVTVVAGTVSRAHLLGKQPPALPDEEPAGVRVGHHPRTVRPGQARAGAVVEAQPDPSAACVEFLRKSQ